MLHLDLMFLIVLYNNHVVLLLNHAPDQTQQNVYTISHIVIQQSPRLRNLIKSKLYTLWPLGQGVPTFSLD